MAAALAEGIVVTVAPILAEMLVGLNPGRRSDSRAIEHLRDLELVGLDWQACELAGAFGRALAGRGRRVPTVDLLMAGAAATGGHEIWHIGGTEPPDIHARRRARKGRLDPVVLRSSTGFAAHGLRAAPQRVIEHRGQFSWATFVTSRPPGRRAGRAPPGRGVVALRARQTSPRSAVPISLVPSAGFPG